MGFHLEVGRPGTQGESHRNTRLLVSKHGRGLCSVGGPGAWARFVPLGFGPTLLGELGLGLFPTGAEPWQLPLVLF